MRNNWLEILYFYLSFVTLTTIEIEIKQKEKKKKTYLRKHSIKNIKKIIVYFTKWK